MRAPTTETKMTRVVAVVLLAGLTWLGGSSRVPAQGQGAASAPGLEDSGHFSFHRMGDGFIRLDSHTGQLAQCGWNATGWSCKAVPDEREALESEIARLQRQNAELKKSLLSRGLDLPAGVMADAPAAKAPGATDKGVQAPSTPAEADLDRAIAYMKYVWRRLVEMMVELQRDIQRKS
jgi:hypothetical protein